MIVTVSWQSVNDSGAGCWLTPHFGWVGGRGSAFLRRTPGSGQTDFLVATFTEGKWRKMKEDGVEEDRWSTEWIVIFIADQFHICIVLMLCTLHARLNPGSLPPLSVCKDRLAARSFFLGGGGYVFVVHLTQYPVCPVSVASLSFFPLLSF